MVRERAKKNPFAVDARRQHTRKTWLMNCVRDCFVFRFGTSFIAGDAMNNKRQFESILLYYFIRRLFFLLIQFVRFAFLS